MHLVQVHQHPMIQLMRQIKEKILIVRFALFPSFLAFFAMPVTAQPFFEDATAHSIGVLRFPPAGMVFADYNNDGRPDLFLASGAGFGPGDRITLMNNLGNGRFANHTPQVELALDVGLGDGAAFADYDNDGDLDAFLTIGSITQSGRDLLLRNDNGPFRPVTLEAGLIDSLPTENAIWMDYDRDGHLDLYLGHWSIEPPRPDLRNRLWRNQGDDTFTDVTQDAGLDVQLHPSGGGSAHGMVAADFNNDGWPDLYLAVWQGENRMFLNTGEGRFVDATTTEIGDPGRAFGAAVGDIDNDGDLDLFHASGASIGSPIPSRSLMLLNLGDATYLDVTEGVGLGDTYALDVTGPGLQDIDNDGDLDLLIASPQFLFLNDGHGLFENHTDLSGLALSTFGLSVPPTFGDYDGDGFLDLIFTEGKLYRNRGNANHWLRVELVGIESNRSGIGTRVFATTGERRQMREILGGNGFSQNELVAHFGLGEHTIVDTLEIHWPSGTVDRFFDVVADQKIRAFEGRPGYHLVAPSEWEHTIPDTVLPATVVEILATVRPALFEPDAKVNKVSADLSAIGGPSLIQLNAQNDGSFRLDTVVEVNGEVGSNLLFFRIEQATFLGPYWTELSRRVILRSPGADLLLFGDELAEIVRLEILSGHFSAAAESREAFEGNVSVALESVDPMGSAFLFNMADPVSLGDYSALRFAFHPGTATLSEPPSGAGGPSGGAPPPVGAGSPGSPMVVGFEGADEMHFVELDEQVDLELKAWQEVVISLLTNEIAALGPISAIFFGFALDGQFFIDDIRLVALASESATAVSQEADALPHRFLLSQNYPNPFNSETVIPFALSGRGEVDLEIYNLAGQKVATLVNGVREAGAHSIRWDGTDERGRLLGSGVYLYRLRAGDTHRETRKLLLLR